MRDHDNAGPRSAALALGGYLVLTLALTYPLARYFTRAIPGDGFDGWQNYWNLWWVRTALLEQHTHPFFTNLLYYPTGVGLLFHTLNPFNGVMSLPLQIAAGLFPAYNGIVLFSFAVGGLGAYLVARQALGREQSRLPAFVAGVVFTFSPFHFAHLLGHMQVLSLEWIPFYALYLLRAVQVAPGARKAPILRNALLAALFLALIALCDWYYVLYAMVLTAVIVGWAVWRVPWTKSRRVLLAAAITWGAWAVALSPLLAPMVREARQYRFMVPDPAQSRALSADLLAFLTPQGFHPLWGDWARQQSKVFTSSLSEFTVFAGFVALALAAIGCWITYRRSRSGAATLRAWPPVLLTFLVLALGPVLHIGGRTELLPGGREIPLPYGLLVRALPFMEITRSVSRFDVVVMLALGVLAAAGSAWLLRLRRAGRWAVTAAMALLLFEYLPAPYPLTQADTPDWYQKLAADPRPGAVLNLPMGWDRPAYLLHQTTHHKPLAVAYISREDPRTLTDRSPVLQHFRHLGPDIIQFDLAEQGQQVLHDLGIRWVVLDRYQMPGGEEREYTDAAAGQIFSGQPAIYADDRLTVYEVMPPARQAPYLILGDGWQPFEGTSRTRTFLAGAVVNVQAPAEGQVVLGVTLAQDSAGLDLPMEGGEYVLRVPVRPGSNQVWLRSQEPDKRVVVRSLALKP